MRLKQYDQVVRLWQSYKIASVAYVDKYLDSFRVLFAFHSGKIDEAEELNTLYEFFKYETEKAWEKALALAGGMKVERKGLSDYNQSI